MPARRLSLEEEVDTRQYASKDTRPRREVDLEGPTSIEKGNECQQGR